MEKRFLSLEKEPDLECTEEIPTTSKAFTRQQQTSKYKKELCFFCDGKQTQQHKLHHVAYDTAGANLREAVELSGNNTWLVRLNECINPTDAHAIDVLYHAKCWANHVTNVIRKRKVQTQVEHSSTALVASDIEFISMVEEFLAEGNVTCMADLHNTYINVCYSNGIDASMKIRSRRELKLFIEDAIPGVEFSHPKRKNESERVCLKHTKDAAIVKLEEDSYEEQFRTLLPAALVIRKAVLNAKRWLFDGSMDADCEQIPELLSVFFKWCLVGKGGVSSVPTRVNEIDARVNRLSQILMFECLSQDQVARAPDSSIKHRREFPLQVSIGLSVHQLTRSSNLVNFLHSVGLSVHYSRIWDIENKIAKSVIAKMNEQGGLYLPSDIVSGRFIHFAVDNIDFQEDTPDGRNTLHGTVIVAYQTIEDGDVSEKLTLLSDDEDISIPKNIYPMLSCSLPKGLKPTSPTMNVDVPTANKPGCLKAAVTQDIIWMLGGGTHLKTSQTSNEVLST